MDENDAAAISLFRGEEKARQLELSYAKLPGWLETLVDSVTVMNEN